MADMIPTESASTKRMTVTPAQAQEWLKVNAANRPLRRSSVTRMAFDMRSGNWNQLNPQPIIFDTTGALIDGQHRLTAQVEADMALCWSVAFEVPRQAQLVIDDHIPRQVHDYANWEMPDHKVTTRHVACARAMLQGVPGSRSVAPSRSTLYRFLRTHMAAIEFALGAFSKRVKHVTTANTACVLARASYSHDPAKLRRFAEVLETGQPIDATESAAVTVSRWLLERSRHTQSREQYAKLERGLLAFLKGESLGKLLPAAKELFPLPEERTTKEPDDDDPPAQKVDTANETAAARS